MYQRKHSIDNINWMIMVGQSTRIEINFDELTAAMGFRNWIYMQDERVLRGIDGIRISFPIRKYCALSCILAQEWAKKKTETKRKILQVLSFDLNHYIWGQTLECPQAMPKTEAQTKCTACFFSFLLNKKKRANKKHDNNDEDDDDYDKITVTKQQHKVSFIWNEERQSSAIPFKFIIIFTISVPDCVCARFFFSLLYFVGCYCCWCFKAMKICRAVAFS